MSIGNIEFQSYCNKHNIPNSQRIWTWSMWSKAYELGKLKSDKTIRCPECNSEHVSFMCGECGHSEVSVG